MTVAVDTLDLREEINKRDRLIDELSEGNNWPALVFVSSPDKANQLAIDVSAAMALSEDSAEFADWLAHNVGERNFLSEAVEMGVGIHHGRVPRAIAARMIQLFNYETLPVLLCTSTLIEGVNTRAKTVMIYDKSINNRDYDFFTFSNIRGRAGRLGQHHVGKVLLFNDVPDREELEIAPTIFGDEDQYPDEYIVHLDERERPSRSRERYVVLSEALQLDPEDMRTASSIGLEKAVQLRKALHAAFDAGARLGWRGVPRYNEMLAVNSVICEVQSVNSFGARSPKQLTYFLDQLRRAETLRAFLIGMDESFKGRPHEADWIFKFLRACEYGLAQYYAVSELFVQQVNDQTDYSAFYGGMSSWFRPELLKELDEEAIPIQIAERFYRSGDDKAALISRMMESAKATDDRLSEFERSWLLDVISPA
jgi:hypothetical protein